MKSHSLSRCESGSKPYEKAESPAEQETMTLDDDLAQLQRELEATQTTAASMVGELVSSIAYDDMASIAASFDRWAEHPDSDRVASQLARLMAEAVRKEMG